MLTSCSNSKKSALRIKTTNGFQRSYDRLGSNSKKSALRIKTLRDLGDVYPQFREFEQ